MQIPQDYHMHTRFSEDGQDSLEAMCRRALIMGIPEIGFSEHWDVGPYEQNPRFFQPEPWFQQIALLREKYTGSLVIRTGIEIAEPHLYASAASEVLKLVIFDYVIGSVHWVGSRFMFDAAYFSQHTADEIYAPYFKELERMVSCADIDIVAHLDVPARTAKPIVGYDPSRYEAQLRGILEIIIHRGLALDLNAAGMRKPAQNLMPDPLILKWYAEMGGERITLGSDAHQSRQVGQHLEVALQAARAAGLTHLTGFENRCAYILPL